MAFNLYKIFALFLIFLSLNAFSQNEYFHEIAFEKKLIKNEKWDLFGEANFKNLYNQPGWRRWGVSVNSVRKFNHLGIWGGINGYYTFDKSITNFFEIRPWTNVQYNIPAFKRYLLRQRLRYEWRFFHPVENSSTSQNYGRLRYQIGFDIPIASIQESSWRIRPYFEWFFIRDPATFERFSNERDFGLMAIRRFRNDHELFFGFTREVYYELETKNDAGYIFWLVYSF